jgi:hypothetical protein
VPAAPRPPKFRAPVQKCEAKLKVFHWSKLGDAQIEGTVFSDILKDASFKVPMIKEAELAELFPAVVTKVVIKVEDPKEEEGEEKRPAITFMKDKMRCQTSEMVRKKLGMSGDMIADALMVSARFFAKLSNYSRLTSLSTIPCLAHGYCCYHRKFCGPIPSHLSQYGGDRSKYVVFRLN